MSSRTIHRPQPNTDPVTVDTTVIGGVDTHSQTHHAAVLDHLGRLLATRGFPATGPGYHALLAWLTSFGTLERVGVEGTSSYGAGLTRYLISHGVWVIEVNRPNRQARRQRGKSDPLDAENAARRALSGEQTIIPKDTSSALESIRTLRIARSGASRPAPPATTNSRTSSSPPPRTSATVGAARPSTASVWKPPGYDPTPATSTTPTPPSRSPCAPSRDASPTSTARSANSTTCWPNWWPRSPRPRSSWSASVSRPPRS